MEKHVDYTPWKRLSRKPIYENNWIIVTEDQVINPRGGQNLYGHFSFKNRAIGIIPIDEEGNTWLVGQARYALDEYSWEIPMGGGPIEDSPLESAKRELQEETGLTASNWEELIRIHTSNSVTDEVGIAYIARELSQGPTNFDDTEDLRIWKLPLKDAVNMVLKQEITDSLSVAALLKASIILQN